MAEELDTSLGDIESFASMGAGLGSVIPGLGTLAGGLIGGGAGLLKSIFGKPKQVPNFDDPNAWMRDYAANQLLTSNIGAKTGAATAGQELNFARDQAEAARNNPNLAGNAAAQAGISNKLLLNAEHGAQSAMLSGAELDTANKARAANIAGESSRIAQSNFMLNQAYRDRPSFGQQALMQGLSTSLGEGVSSLFAPKEPDVAPQISPSPSSNVPDRSDFLGGIDLGNIPGGVYSGMPSLPQTSDLQQFGTPPDMNHNPAKYGISASIFSGQGNESGDFTY